MGSNLYGSSSTRGQNRGKAEIPCDRGFGPSRSNGARHPGIGASGSRRSLQLQGWGSEALLFD
eukprot:4592563-Alexandrium_andersonii.AAC.1